MTTMLVVLLHPKVVNMILVKDFFFAAIKISENSRVFISKSSRPLKTTKKKYRCQKKSQKFNSKEYDKCRENLKNFLEKLKKFKNYKCISLEEMKKDFKIDFDELPNDDDIIETFDTIYKRYSFKLL